MQPLSNLEMVSLWERGQRLHHLDRGLLALAEAAPDTPWAQLADLPLGQRNRAIVELRAATFGPAIAGWLPCPNCAEKLEFTLDSNTLQAAPETPKTIDYAEQTFHLPTSRTLAQALLEPDSKQAVQRLIEAGSDASAALEDNQIAELGTLMAEADPLAYPTLAFACDLCGAAWEEPLDLVHFLWTELEARVRRILRDVHILARAYGWSEATVLALSDQRRALYLEMVQDTVYA